MFQAAKATTTGAAEQHSSSKKTEGCTFEEHWPSFLVTDAESTKALPNLQMEWPNLHAMCSPSGPEEGGALPSRMLLPLCAFCGNKGNAIDVVN